MNRRFAIVGALVLLALAACQDKQAQLPDRANFRAAVEDYLARRGHLCLAKYEWPIAVTEADRQAHSAVAQQMDLLETLRLVTSRAANGSATARPAREYALTAEGSKYYLHVPVVVSTATQHVTHPADFCVARLSMDRLFGWEKPLESDGRTVSSVLFSYRIVDAAPWLRTPDARRAFPMTLRSIDNAGTLQLRLGVHLTPQGWVADELSQ